MYDDRANYTRQATTIGHRVCMNTLDPLTHFWRNMRDVYLLEHMSVRVYFLAPIFS